MTSLPITCLQTFVNIPKIHSNFWKKYNENQPPNMTNYKKDKDSLHAERKWHYHRKRVAMVGRISRYSRKSLKLQRRLCWGLNALSPTTEVRECCLLRDVSILSWEEIRRKAQWSNRKLHLWLYYSSSLLYICSLYYMCGIRII